MRLLLLVLICGLRFNSLAQYSLKEAPLFVRGKALGSIFIQDAYIGNITIGIEKQINKYHSFGIDYIGYREYNDKNDYDSLGNETTIEYRQRTSRKQLLIDYRFYLTDIIFKDNKKLYFNIFFKSGKARIWSEKDYNFDMNELIWQNESIKDLGFAIGLRSSSVGEIEYLGIDINFGFAKHYIIENYEVYLNDNSTELFQNKKRDYITPLLRLNLYFNLNTLWQ